MLILAVTTATSSLVGTEDLADAVEKRPRRYERQGEGRGTRCRLCADSGFQLQSHKPSYTFGDSAPLSPRSERMKFSRCPNLGADECMVWTTQEC